jgi:predicted DNA-binding protein (MmcQ/YjbR family)
MGRGRSRVHPYLTKLRRLAGSFPETAEVEAWGHPTFRVRNKIFASFGERDGQPTIGVKQTLGDQTILIQDARFYVSPYVGKHGWIGILVDEVEWEFVADLVESSYRLIATKRLVRALDDALG